MFETNIKKVKLVFLFPQKDWRKVIFVQKKRIYLSCQTKFSKLWRNLTDFSKVYLCYNILKKSEREKAGYQISANHIYLMQ